MEKLGKLKELIKTVMINSDLETENIDINTDTNLREHLGLDSLDLAELTVRIEEEYSIDVFEDGIIETVGEILEKLSNA